MLPDEDDVTVVGECGDGSQVVGTAVRIRPDVVLMVLSMPVMNGTATEALRAVRPEAGIVMVTGEGHAADPWTQPLVRRPWCRKAPRLGAMLRCLHTVACGCRCCPCCP